MSQQIDYEKWLDRIDNTLAIQRDYGYETISQTYTRRELIELRMMVSGLYAEQLKQNSNSNSK